jgi:intracellular sulfur oxidation DsrE/DsrF family protein
MPDDLKLPEKMMVRDATRLCQLASLALMGIVFAGLGTWLILAGPNPVAASAPLPSSTIKTHRVVVLVDSDDMKVMKHAISYSFNAARYYNAKSEPITIEIVANGTGIKLFRADVSPLQDILMTLRTGVPEIVFSVCASSKTIAEQNEGHPIAIIDSARLVPFGIGRLIDLQEAGWTYVHA